MQVSDVYIILCYTVFGGKIRNGDCWSQTKVVVSCVLPHQERASWDEHTATMETGVLQLHVRSCGTAFQLNCDKLTYSFQRFKRLLKTFLFGCWNRQRRSWVRAPRGVQRWSSKSGRDEPARPEGPKLEARRAESGGGVLGLNFAS